LAIEAAAGLPETQWPELALRIEQRIRELLTFRPAVTLLPFGSLPRTGGKTKLIEVTPQP